jgi:hypothetical protein
VPVDETLGVVAEIVGGVEGPFQHVARDVLGHVARPALGGVEGDHAKRVRILAAQEIADDRFAIGFGGTGRGILRTHTNKRFNSDHRRPFRGILTNPAIVASGDFQERRSSARVGGFGVGADGLP